MTSGEGEACLPECPLPGYVLRPAGKKDIVFIVKLDRLHMKAEVESCYPGSWSDENAVSIVSENLDGARVLEFGGRVVGCYYWWTEQPSIAVLYSIQIAEAHRGKGLGTWLMSCFETEARQRGLRQAGLAVFESNPALRWYEKLGYEVTGKDGPHALEMQKPL